MRARSNGAGEAAARGSRAPAGTSNLRRSAATTPKPRRIVSLSNGGTRVSKACSLDRVIFAHQGSASHSIWLDFVARTVPTHRPMQAGRRKMTSPPVSCYSTRVTSILVADDHGIVREGLRRLLETESDFQVCGEALDGREALEQVEKHEPDVIVLDITMPRLGGLETLERLRSKHGKVKVILLSAHGDPSFIRSAISLGADGYVLKNSRASEVVSAIRAVTKGGSYFSPAVAREIVEQLRSPKATDDEPFTLLSSREREVLHLIAEGLSAKEVASDLSISTKTVEAHRSSLMRKLGVRKATELVRYALRHGLIEP